MKAEPDSRIVKGIDVKFSVDDFEQVKTTAWEGVRSAEAKNIMCSMRIGDQVLFYHSNCKNPGIAAFAEVSKEAYPDHTAWDPEHPYYDAKTDKDNPKWFMVDVTFKSRLNNFIPLSLVRRLAEDTEPPPEVAYIGIDGVKAIKNMALIKKGRLSVQPVADETWVVIEKLAEQGGWENLDLRPGKKRTVPKARDTEKTEASSNAGRKRKTEESEPVRRSTRQRKWTWLLLISLYFSAPFCLCLDLLNECISANMYYLLEDICPNAHHPCDHV